MTSCRRVTYSDLVEFDRARRGDSNRRIAGVDEAGRGALAGPVVAAAVVCDPHKDLTGVNDSKLISEKYREDLYEKICGCSLDWCVAIVEAAEIDRINILRATLLAMKRAVNGLDPSPELVLVDGNHLPDVAYPSLAVKGGDAKSFSIAAASIVAKVTRDRIMRGRDKDFPGYGFERNKGYGTREHISALKERGRTEFHRRSFRIHSNV